jgi:hypothetical protein
MSVDGVDFDQPEWLAVLASAQAARRLPPYGLVWEEPPPKQTGRSWRVAPQLSAGYRIPAHVPVMPSRHRAGVVGFLARNPDRWARVYDGGPSTCDATVRLLKVLAVNRRVVGDALGTGRLEVTSRGFGSTVALFARFRTHLAASAPDDGDVRRRLDGVA